MSEPLFKPEDFKLGYLLSLTLHPNSSPNLGALLDEHMARLTNILHEARCPYKQVMALKDENARLRDALKLVLMQDRIRGYPTGQEWIELVEQVIAALEGK